MSESSNGRSAMVVGSGILISRVLGLLRTTFFAHYFGSTAAGDAFNVASRIPNAIRNLLGAHVDVDADVWGLALGVWCAGAIVLAAWLRRRAGISARSGGAKAPIRTSG